MYLIYTDVRYCLVHSFDHNSVSREGIIKKLKLVSEKRRREKALWWGPDTIMDDVRLQKHENNILLETHLLA